MSDALHSLDKVFVWPDLTAHGVTLGIVLHDDRKSSLIFVDPAEANKGIARNMGFSKTRWPGLWTRSDIRVEASAFRAAFPDVKVVRRTLQEIADAALEQIRAVVEASRQSLLPGFEPIASVDALREPTARMAPRAPRQRTHTFNGIEGEVIDLSPLVSEGRLLGVNIQGHDVYESPDGARFARFLEETEAATVERVEREVARLSADDTQAAYFLRGNTEGALLRSADAFVMMMANGHTARVDELQRFFYAVTGREFAEQDPDLPHVITAIDKSRVRKLAQLVISPDDEAFHAALRLHEAAQYYTVVKDHRMTPLPISVALQHIAGAMPEDSSVRIDNEQHGEFSSFGEGVSRFTRSAEGALSDLLLATYEGRLLEQSMQAFGTSVSRADHANVLTSIGKMAPEGMGIYLIGGDQVPGRIGPSSRRFLDALATQHEIEGIVDIDGSLMGVPGAAPSRMIVVGKKREIPGHGGLPPAVPYVTDYPSLWSWSGQITNAIRKPGSVPYVERGGVAKDTVIGENAFQAPYIPASLLTEPSLMVPRNLASPLRRAMIEIEKEIPHIDPWLEKRLQYEPGGMNGIMSAEQADAVVMGLKRMDAGLGFMVADQTGIGKGRIIALLARATRVAGEPVVFLTETADLFTDLWRDIEDTNSEGFFKNIMILNDNESITSTKTGEVIARSAPREMVDRTMRSMEMPPDVDIVFATYSQFNRDPIKAIRNHSEIAVDELTASTLSASTRKLMDWVQGSRRAAGLKDAKTMIVEAVDISAEKDLVAKMPMAAVKSLWIGKATKGALLLMDEAHNASGETSQTNLNLDHGVLVAKNVVYSSATFARTAKNMRIYRRLFPASVDVEGLHETLKKGGEPLQEALSSMLAEDGGMIRREHDFSMLKFVAKIDHARLSRNEEYTDKLAEILAAMTFLTRETRQLTDALSTEMREKLIALNESLKNGGSTMQHDVASVGIVKRSSIGNNLYTIMRAFLVLLKVDEAADEAIADLREGRKPVLVVDHTLEAELNKRIDEAKEAGLVTETEDGLLMKSPGFRSILLDRLESMSKVSLDGQDLELMRRPEFAAAVRHIEKLIGEFPDIESSPIDLIRGRIEAEGYTVGELSGRKRRLIYGNDGQCTVVNIPTKERRQAKNRFNNGDVDALMLTRAGNAGISLHDSPRFVNSAQRVLIEVEVPEDVIARMQFFGRVNRNGQRTHPWIKTLSTGLPAENRVLALQNNKLRLMSANTTGNRDNSAITKEVADVINSVGNEVAYRLLELNPELAETLDINIERNTIYGLEDANDKLTGVKYISELMNRLVVLRVQEQKKIIETVNKEFNALIEELDAKGENPLKARFYDIHAKRIHEEVLEASMTEALPGTRVSSFDKPVMISTIRYNEYLEPMPGGRLLEEIRDGRAQLAKDVDESYGETDAWKAWRLVNPDEPFMEFVADQLIASKEKILQRYLSGTKTLADAMADADSNIIKQMNFKIDALISTMATLRVGSRVNYFDQLHEKFEPHTTVVGFKSPDPDEIHYAGRYTVWLAVPGQTRLVAKSLSSLLGTDGFRVEESEFNKETLKVFDGRKSATFVVERPILDGNLFRAAEMSIQSGKGTQAYYSDENGLTNRAVVLPKDLSPKAFSKLPLRVYESVLAQEFFDAMEFASMRSSSSGRNQESAFGKSAAKGLKIEKNKTETIVSVPGSRHWIDWLKNHPELMKITGPFGGTRDKLFAVLPNRLTTVLVEAVYATGITLYAHADDGSRPLAGFGAEAGTNSRAWFATKMRVEDATTERAINDPFADVDKINKKQPQPKLAAATWRKAA